MKRTNCFQNAIQQVFCIRSFPWLLTHDFATRIPTQILGLPKKIIIIRRISSKNRQAATLINSSLLIVGIRFFNSELKQVNNVQEDFSHEQKLVKVAILGRPNVGKSTLINRILQANVCDVSSKTHTTRFPVRTAFVSGNTQVIFVDTPGLVTKKEVSRFNLKKNFTNWKSEVFKEVDVVGVVEEVRDRLVPPRIPIGLLSTIESLNNLKESKPVFFILNKIDKLKGKNWPSESTDWLLNSYQINNKNLFSKVFLASALKNVGVEEIVEYLLGKAKIGQWIFDGNQICDTPINLLILNLLRAKIMNIVPQEIPYLCRYEIEYLEENPMGELICVALITCQKMRHQRMIVQKRKKSLKDLCMEIESDLYSALKKVVRLRVVVTTVDCT